MPLPFSEPPPIPELVDDLTLLTQAEHMKLALAVLIASSTKLDGNPKLSIWKTAAEYDIPCNTLTDCWNGTPTCYEGHAHELLLTPAQEEMFVDWIKVMGHWGIPFTATVIADYVADIISCDVSDSWVRCFKSRHPELKVKWTLTLERCCTSLLNLALVNEFYDLLEDILMKYQIPSENIYNMDEKGIQLGIRQKIKAFVDHN
jgi:hypothetical protein